jgi:CRISPR system Cascade subunit CasD
LLGAFGQGKGGMSGVNTGVVLLLDGPLQSWGTQSRFGHRDTDFEPSKSGVIGLVGAAMGMGRDDAALLQRLASLEMAVRVDREGTVLRDYHTAGGGTFRGEPHRVYGVETVVTQRFYLCDACFVVALSHLDSGLIAEIAAALQNPVWPIFLGRKSCVPSRPVYLLGPLEGNAEALIRTVPFQVAKPAKEQPATLRAIVDGSQGEPRGDVPVSFNLYGRSFTTRFVREQWIPVTDLPGGQDVSESTSA